MTDTTKLDLLRSIDFQELIDEIWLADEITELVENTVDKLTDDEIDDILRSKQMID